MYNECVDLTKCECLVVIAYAIVIIYPRLTCTYTCISLTFLHIITTPVRSFMWVVYVLASIHHALETIRRLYPISSVELLPILYPIILL